MTKKKQKGKVWGKFQCLKCGDKLEASSVKLTALCGCGEIRIIRTTETKAIVTIRYVNREYYVGYSKEELESKEDKYHPKDLFDGNETLFD